MTANAPKVICWGEILWDVFPDQSLIGGARLMWLSAIALVLRP